MVYSRVNLNSKVVDIEVVDGIITAIEPTITCSDKLDCNEALIVPGLVDLSVNVFENSLSSKTLKKLSIEAKKGGVTHIVLNSTSTPAIDNEIVLEFVLKHQYNANGATLQSSFSAINEDGLLSNISILQKKGAVAPFIKTDISNNTISKIAQYLQMNENTLFCRAVDESLSDSGVMNEGAVSSELGLAGVPELSEVLHVTQMIEIAKEFNINVLFKNIA
ncbi:MAG: dihydroorotase, partial [Campylobacterota bacterium]|nr:dihydroorotase [Campylobacterota bacterium]